MTPAEFRGSVAAALAELAGPGASAAAYESAMGEDNLFDRGLVDSLSIVGLLAWIEESAGERVDLEKIDPVSFFTVDGMYRFIVQARVGRLSGEES